MVSKGNGQITIIDLNDAIKSGTPPKNPVEGTLWIDSSVNPNVLKVWKLGEWVKQNLSIEELDPEFSGIVDDLKEFTIKAASDGIITSGEKLNIKLLLVELTGSPMTTSMPTIAQIDESKSGQVYQARAGSLAAGVTEDHLSFVAFTEAYNNLRTYLNGLIPKIWDSGDTNIETVEWDDKWNSYYRALSNLQTTTAEFLAESIKPGKSYNGVTITETSGIVIRRGDNIFETILNATEGISISAKNDLGLWEKVFYAGLDGNLYATRLVISGTSMINGMIAEDLVSSTQSTKESVDAMTSDMNITPVEKGFLKRDWENIKAEYLHLSSEAAKSQVDKTNYDAAYNALNSNPPKIETEILSAMSTVYTFSSQASRDIFDTKLTTYYNEAEKIRLLLTDKKLQDAETYTYVMYADTILGEGMSESSAGKKYMGISYNNKDAEVSMNPLDYKWALIQGPQGINGKPGEDGRTSYTHIAYANNATGTDGFSLTVSTGKSYIGMYIDFVITDSTDPTKYKWTLIKGADGAQGVPGKAGADGKTPYFHTAWATNSTGTAGFSTTVSAGKTYIGTYTDFTKEDSVDPTKYSWVLIKGEKGPTGPQGPNKVDSTTTFEEGYDPTNISPDGANLLPNGSFEDGERGWKFNSRHSITTNGVHGAKCLRIAAGTGTTSLNLKKDTLQVTPGNTYRISFLYRTSADADGTTGNQKFRIGKTTDSGYFTSLAWAGPQTTWAKLEELFTVPEGATEIKPSFMSNHTKGWVEIDNLIIEDITDVKAVGDVQDLWKYKNTVKIDGGQIYANTVTANEINVVSLASLSANLGAVTAGTIDASKVTVSNINASNITAGTMDAARITAGTITSTQIKVGGINANRLTAGTITAKEIKAGSITSDELNILAKSLVNNFSNTGSYEGWTGLTGHSWYAAVRGRALSIKSDGNAHIKSELFEVNPNQTYKFSMSTYSKQTGGSYYIGLNCFDENKKNVGCYTVLDGDTTIGALSTNPYFISNRAKKIEWEDFEGYLAGAQSTPEEIPLGKNNTRNFIMHPTTKYVQFRFLNYYNAGVLREMLFYSPSVISVDSGRINANSITAGTIKGIDIEGVTITGSTIISTKSDNIVKLTSTIKQGQFKAEIEEAYSKSKQTTEVDGYGVSSSVGNESGGYDNATLHPRGIEFFHRNGPSVDGYFVLSTDGAETSIGTRELTLRLPQNEITGLEIGTLYGDGQLGARNALDFHFETNMPRFYMYKPLKVNGRINAVGGLEVGGAKGGYVYTNAIQNDISGNHIYARTGKGGEVRATVSDTTTSYIPVRASSHPTSSSEKYKTNIEKYIAPALPKVMDAVIYQYNLINEYDEGIDKERYGMIIERETPEEFIDEDGVEPYSIVSLLMKSVQELSEKVSAIENKINQR